MEHTAVSVTHLIWQNKTKEKFCNFATFDIRYSKRIQIYKRWLENESKPIINFRFLRITSLISKDQKENIICTTDDIRGDLLGILHDTTPAAVIANKTRTEFL